MQNGVWNTDLFTADGKLKGIGILITDGEKKLSTIADMLKTYGIKISESTVIGDSKADMPLMAAAKFAIASPYATEEVVNMAHIQIPVHVQWDQFSNSSISQAQVLFLMR